VAPRKLIYGKVWHKAILATAVEHWLHVFQGRLFILVTR
jgi:hypothetical protein